MILKIWAKIFFILVLISGPLILAQYWTQKESAELIFKLQEKSNPRELVDKHLQILKDIAKLDPQHEEEYRAQFEEALASKINNDELNQVKGSLIKNLLYQALQTAAIILAFAFLISLVTARGIVSLIKKLLAENEKYLSRLEQMESLKTWQRMARVLVHEIRAPVTPIKLIASDLEGKYAALPANEFFSYLGQGMGLVRQQISAIERMMQSFSQFAKLPEVQKAPGSISTFFKTFIANSTGQTSEVEFSLDLEQLKQDSIPFDAGLLNQLFFNLLQNAKEANQGQHIRFAISVLQTEDMTSIQIRNSGRLIPSELQDQIFEMHISSKADKDNSNQGLGLTICKKIALDHGGDLILLHNSPQEGVVFEMELPNKEVRAV